MGSTLTLVSVYTKYSISSVTCQASTGESTIGIGAHSVRAAIIGFCLTFINVFTPVAFLRRNALKAGVADVRRSNRLGPESRSHCVVEHALVALVGRSQVHTFPVRRAWMVIALINVLALISSNGILPAADVLTRLAFITAGQLNDGLTMDP